MRLSEISGSQRRYCCCCCHFGLVILVLLAAGIVHVSPEFAASTSRYRSHLSLASRVAAPFVDDFAVSMLGHAPSGAHKDGAMYGRRRRRQAPEETEEQHEKCRLFVEGEPEKSELYSPDYPSDYPKNINCTRVITAPKGQIIRLDFRNSFHIEEKEECKFDFLEIRDGQYGFSNLIGKYCGTDFPPEITSRERYLWLHFHSDESIEYSGFTAVYEFIDRSRDAPSTDLNCTIEKDGYEGFVNSTDVPPEIKDMVIRNKVPLDCMWRIQVQDKWKIQVKFLDFKLSKPNDCETNFLDFFPEQTVMPLRVKNFCGSAGEGITSDSNILHMRFYAEQSAINSTFAILYTAFREPGGAGCAGDEHDCEDATCIAQELKCNGRDNCKFRWDEENCPKESETQSEHVVIIIVVFGLILGGMIITFLVNCVRKIMRDQKIIREAPGVRDNANRFHIDSFVLDAPKAAVLLGVPEHSFQRMSSCVGHRANGDADSRRDAPRSATTSFDEAEEDDEQLFIISGNGMDEPNNGRRLPRRLQLQAHYSCSTETENSSPSSSSGGRRTPTSATDEEGWHAPTCEMSRQHVQKTLP